MNKKKNENNKGYATVLEDDGINYREIADIMSEVGFVMNHSSARNYILRVMTKFVEAFDDEWELGLTDEKVRSVAASPQFQNVISDLLHNLETVN
ncbi:MAG: hypothetical protein FJ267_09850 [Planctomycetes bacterium]|nr:hypothetical protein [Planctomycetota bacterium]